jgi:SAM-dependent methyltransferase
LNRSFTNVYGDDRRANAYARLEFPGTYALACRDVPAILREHVQGRRAFDFGCGTGRSTRFLTRLGFATIGADIAPEMVTRARDLDPGGSYHVITGDGLDRFPAGDFDVVLSAFTFDNVPTAETKVTLFRALGRLLAADGRIVSVVSSQEIYVNEWASFTTRDFPENRGARSGDTVRIVMLDVADRRPVEDVLWSDEAYQAPARRGLTHRGGPAPPTTRAQVRDYDRAG